MRLRLPLCCCLFGFSLFASAPSAQTASGGQSVHRCLGNNGEIAFTGLPCRAGDTADLPSGTPAAILPTTACPASLGALRDRIANAIARRDANAIAGLLRWRDIGGRAAGARLHSLGELVQRPLLAIDSDRQANPSEEEDSYAGEALRVRTGSNESGGIREQSFGVRREGGCYWLIW